MSTTITDTQYRRWCIISLVVMVVTAWFSVGFYHPDEHFQVLEFYSWKKGLSPAADLPWEFGTHCRAALQPFIVYCVGGVLNVIGITDPFMLAFVLRLMMAVLTWYTAIRLIRVLTPSLSQAKAQWLYAAANLFLWFVPYIGVRFSSEAIAADLFFLALSLIIYVKDEAKAQQVKHIAVAGLLLGFTLFFRLQMAFAFAGLGIWVLFVSKWAWHRWLLLAAFVLVAMGLSVVVDHWFYGIWTFTPYNYFDVNIIQKVAAKFGVEPWWWYITKFIKMGIEPFSIPLLILFGIGIWRKPLHLFSLVSITFFIGHFAIGHKEMRFLFPGSFAFIYIACLGADVLLQRFTWRKGYTIAFRVLAGVNIAILVFKMFTPAEEVMNYFKFINYHSRQQPTTLIAFGKSPYRMGLAECNFYKYPGMKIQVLDSATQLPQVLADNKGRDVILLNDNLSVPAGLAGYNAQRIYCEYPDWVLRNNINNWQERSYIWAVFRVSSK